MSDAIPIILAIDVGTAALGAAVFRHNRKLEAPIRALVVKASRPKEGDWLAPFVEMANVVEQWLDDQGWEPKVYALEWAEYRAGAVGIAAAATESLGKLAFAAGFHAAAAQERGASVLLVPVSSWKGTLKKEVVEQRIVRAVGRVDGEGCKIVDHAMDATGIGLFAKGYAMDNVVFARRAT